MFRLAVAVLIGLALGLAAGLLYAWVLSPVKFTDISPAALVPAERDEYVILAAQAFAADGDLERAQTRLALLGDADSARAVTALAQRASAEGRPPETVAALSALALALGVGPGEAPPTVPVPVETQGPPPATPSLPTPTLAVTRIVPTASATPIFEYELADVQKVCDPALGEPLIQALVQTADGQPIPGVEVLVAWQGGSDHFFTGFKPEFGLGYGDFSMAPAATYTVSLAARSQPTEGLAAEACEGENGQSYLGSWRVTFKRLP